MKIAITQPNFIPWLGYFNLIDSVDLFVALDNVQLVKRSFIVRNKIKTINNTEKWLSTSISSSSQKTLINEAFISKNNSWDIDILNLIKSNYRKSKFYNQYINEISSIISIKKEDELLSNYNLRLIKNFCDLLNIKNKTILSSEIFKKLNGSPEEKILNISKELNASHLYNFKNGVENGLYEASKFSEENIYLVKQDYIHPEYNQLGGSFIPYLSIIDLLFNEGENSKNIINKGDNWITMNNNL